MRIIKDVTILGTIEPIWDLIVSGEKLKIETPNNGHDSDHAYEVFEISPPTKVSYKSMTSGLSVITTLELAQKGKRTNLRVTVTGWEKASPEQAKTELPRISLGWERALGQIKRDIESPAK
jgi:hypothetical protein